jgi:hypothetical protein
MLQVSLFIGLKLIIVWSPFRLLIYFGQGDDRVEAYFKIDVIKV